MSTGAMFGGVGSDASSALRFGLTGLKPLKVSEIVSRFGVKFRRIYTKFVPSDIINSYDEYAFVKYNTIFNSIEIPDYFEVEKLVEIYAQRSIDGFKKDAEYQEKIEELKKSKGTVIPFIDFIVYMKDKYQNNIYDIYIMNANNFYASDISFDVFNDFSRSDHIYANFLNVLHNTLNSYNRRFLMRARHDDKVFYRLFGQMKNELGNIIDLVDELIFYKNCLRRLIVIWNVDNYEEIFTIRNVKYGNIPEDEFLRIQKCLKLSSRSTRKSILTNKYYREDDSIDVKPPALKYLTQDYLKPLFYNQELRLPEWQPQ